jgi:alpha/beta hydrolase fold
MMTELPPLDSAVLPAGIRARFVENVNGLRMHALEAGFETPGRACLLLLHDFPELAYSWRKVMGPLADAGFHVVAPDQRGYGRTTGWDRSYDGDVASFRLFNLVRDTRIISSPKVIDSAEQIGRKILDTYLLPDKSFLELREMVNNNSIDILECFAAACREELESLRTQRL